MTNCAVYACNNTEQTSVGIFSTFLIHGSDSEIPYDNTIPQNTEGVEQITVNITPTDTNNILIVEGYFSGAVDISGGGTGAVLIMSLFQDSIANAIAASSLKRVVYTRSLQGTQ